MNKTIFLTGIAFGLLAIVFGAFGAHTLKELIDSAALQSFETGVRYQMYHALLLLILGKDLKKESVEIKGVYWLISTGTVFFSFSIYILVLSKLGSINLDFLGLMTPFGGVLLIAGWLLLGYRFFRQLNNLQRFSW